MIPPIFDVNNKPNSGLYTAIAQNPNIPVLHNFAYHQHILELERIVEDEGFLYVVIDTSEENLCIPHCTTPNDVESLYKRDSRWTIYEAIDAEYDYPLSVQIEW